MEDDPLKRLDDDLNERLDKIGSNLDEQLQRLGGIISETTKGVPAAPGERPAPTGGPGARSPRGSPARQAPGSPRPGAAPSGSAPHLRDPGAAVRALVLTEADVRQQWEVIRNSTHVSGNPLYAARANDLNLCYDEGDPGFNAYATDHPTRLSSGRTVEPPAIVFLGGFAAAAQVAAFGFAADQLTPDDSRVRVIEAFRAVRQVLGENGGAAPFEAASDAIAEIVPAKLLDDDRLHEPAKTCWASICLGILAHEAGHICYGHTLREERYQPNDVTRNQERDADSFASSVIAGLPHRRDYMIGRIVGGLLMAWCDRHGKDDRSRTHPFSCERLIDACKENAQALKDLGLTVEDVKALLPPDHDSHG
ncbi:MAG: hypothetical protein HYY93_06030 [Planctomycetes bacterium]|nr:hypothetical protein [Planctomycetota bacterium]